MSQKLLRVGLAAFTALSVGVGINLMLLQARPHAGAARAAAIIDLSEAAAARERQLALGVTAKGGLAPAQAPRTTASIRPDALAADAAGTSQLDTVKAIQRELALRGYLSGASDGVPGLVTRAAIMAFEQDNGLPLTAEPSEDVLRRILLGATALPAPQPGKDKRAQAETIIRSVQQTLSGLGYNTGKVDGLQGEDTQRAIRDFENDNEMPETGRISAQLVMRLAKLAGSNKLAR